MLLHISILRSSSGSVYCSLLKLYIKKLITLLYLWVMRQHIICMCICCIPCREVGRLHIHTICCRITHKYNKVIKFLIYNFSKEQYTLPEDGLRARLHGASFRATRNMRLFFILELYSLSMIHISFQWCIFPYNFTYCLSVIHISFLYLCPSLFMFLWVWVTVHLTPLGSHLSISPLSRPTVTIVVLSTLPALKSHSSLVLLSCLVVVVANLQSLQLSTGPPVAVLEAIWRSLASLPTRPGSDSA
jgi:hypothetical protein